MHERKLKLRKIFKNHANKMKWTGNTELDVNFVNKDVFKNT